MFTALLVLNIVILVPVMTGLLRDSDRMASAYGADTEARRILICIYAAITVTSAGVLILTFIGHPWAEPMTVSIFTLQIVYKLLSVWLVGLSNPVVRANLFVAVVQILALAVYALQS